MKEAWSSSDLALLRSRPQGSRWYLAVHVPGSVLSARISSPPSTYPASWLDVTSLSGASSLVKKGMTLLVGSTAGASDKGRLRVSRDMTNSSIIMTAEYGSGLIVPTANNYVTILDQFLPWTIHSKYDTAASVWLIDGEPLAFQLTTYGTQANLGPPLVAFLNGSSVGASFVGNRSQTYGNGSISAYSWDFFNGASTAVQAGAPTSPNTITIPQTYTTGSYYSLTVTDSNGASSIGRRLAFVFNDRSQPARVSFAEIVGGLQNGGYEVEIRATGSAGFDKIPDMAEVVIFEDASYNGTASNIGGNFPFRSNIVFRGYVIGESVRVNPFDSDVLFRATTIDGVLRETEAYDAFLADSRYNGVSASNSIPASSLTIDRMGYYLIQKRSTVGQIADFYKAGGMASEPDLAIFQDLPRSSFWEQLTQNYGAKGILGYVSSDMQGNLHATEDVQISGGSAGLPVGMEINRGDRRGQVIVSRSPIDANSETQLYSVASATPYGAQSPGDVAGYFGRKAEHARGLFVDQNTLTTWAGNYRAKLNSKYKSVVVPLAGNFRYDPVPQSRARMSLSAIDNARGLSWSNKEFLGKQLRTIYNSTAGATLTELEIEEVVNGFGGSAITFPQINTVYNIQPWEPPQIDNPPPPTVGGSGFGTALRLANNTVGMTSDLSASSPSWVSKMGNLDGGGLTIYDLILDPWRPSTTAVIATSGGTYKTDNYRAGSPTWTLLDSQALVRIEGSINRDGWFAGVYIVSTTAYLRYTTDGGDTWASASIATLAQLHSTYYNFCVVPHSIGGQLVLYATFAYYVLAPSYSARMYKSTDSGLTWTFVGTYAGQIAHPQPRALHAPYNGNESGNIVWIGTATSNSAQNGVSYTLTGSTPFTRVLDVAPPYHVRGALETHTQDNQKVATWGTSQLYISEDGGSSFITPAMTGYSGTILGAGGFPYNSQQYYASTNAGLFITQNDGATWTDKTGDWAWTNATGGGHVIVPDWTE